MYIHNVYDHISDEALQQSLYILRIYLVLANPTKVSFQGWPEPYILLFKMTIGMASRPAINNICTVALTRTINGASHF